jgi:NTE family protein
MTSHGAATGPSDSPDDESDSRGEADSGHDAAASRDPEVIDSDRSLAESLASTVAATAARGRAPSTVAGRDTAIWSAAPAAPRRALVLGGGGVLGFAWIVGALSALQVEAGFDARDVDVVVGTSAGAVAAAALGCAVSVDQMRRHHQGIPAADDPPIAFEYDTTGRGLPPWPGFGVGSPRLLLGGVRHPRQSRTLLTLTGALPTGRGSLRPVADMVSSIVQNAGLEGRWPSQPRPWIVAVDYWFGRRVVFGRDHLEALGQPEVSLADAVVASCSIPAWYPPMRIGTHPYIDGGAASNASADLVLDERLDEVYVLAPMASVRFDRPLSPVARIERSIRRAITRGILADVARLRAGGKRVVLLSPGPEDLQLIGANLMDPRRRTEVLDTAMRTATVELQAQLAVRHNGRSGPRSGEARE